MAVGLSQPHSLEINTMNILMQTSLRYFMYTWRKLGRGEEMMFYMFNLYKRFLQKNLLKFLVLFKIQRDFHIFCIYLSYHY